MTERIFIECVLGRFTKTYLHTTNFV